MDDPLTTAEADEASGDLAKVARGGALNLVAAVTYGAANFVLVLIVTNRLGARGAGQFLLAVAIFNILVKAAELGASTGFIRSVSRDLALGRAAVLPRVVLAGLAPVAALGTVLGVVAWVIAPHAAELFGEGDGTAVVVHLRTFAPFLPVAALYSVVVQGTRGFGTMRPHAFVEKIGKAAAQPVAALVVLALGMGPRGLALAWMLPAVVAALPAGLWFRALMRQAMAGAPPVDTPLTDVAREFWLFAAPRALSQLFSVTILWFDTLLIGAILGAGDAGVYTAATRYLLIGTFIAEAVMQVVGPQISALVATGARRRAEQVYRAATGWQVLLIWPAFLLIGLFAPALLELFGPGFADAAPALGVLAGAMLLSSLFGPSDTVVLMSGRSRLSLLNTAVSVCLNVGGNLVLTPRFGLVGAAVAWALSIVSLGGLAAVQAWRALGLHPFGAATGTAAAAAAVTVGLTGLAGRAIFGPTLPALVGVGVIGGSLFAASVWATRDRVGVVELGRAMRRRSGGAAPPNPLPSAAPPPS